MAEKPVRELALDSLMQITEKGVFASAALSGVYAAHPSLSARDRRLYTVLVEETLDQLLRIDYHLDQISRTPVNKMKPLIRALLRMSACQILFLDRIPDHAAVSEAVRIAEKRGFGKLKGFVNGVLRSLARQKDDLALPDERSEPVRYLSVRYSCPEWIVREWMVRFGADRTREILMTFPAKKELALWVNPGKMTAQELRSRLNDAGIAAREHPMLPGMLLCAGTENIEALPGFSEGAFYLQNFSSVLSVLPALHVFSGPHVPPDTQERTLKIIDVCGAPGGKSLYLAAHLDRPARILCRDLSVSKAGRIRENIARLGLTNVEAQVQDACVLCEEDVRSADLVIADLPCSGLGVIPRKADLRYRVKPSDPEDLSGLQREILQTVSQYVRPGGYLLYSTCTVSAAENEEQTHRILRELPFEAVPLKGLPPSVREMADTAQDGYLQILPQENPYRDGFFTSLFRRRTIS